MEARAVTALHMQRKSTAKKPAKQAKKKTKPIKVKYISNPMKVETCASKFRELVQELTGQDAADLPPGQPIFAADALYPVTASVVAENPVPEFQDDQEPYDGADRVLNYFEPLDGDVFVPYVSESFSGCFTNGFCTVNALGSIDSV
ncbi:PREDICTED: sigma factor binding protein 2, chloroplastic-like [Tarenaya hassleriana]|uniref:sigma factor binding protein 2, chloroplastic-like n=1 Tax=Tarenaya hassleriana TaxID=28532 RepID=UPI00053CA342|nr:PREDICTED: sigma factor binding protein 2, chloroplastic-like [Tarenaya hassleriana]